MFLIRLVQILAFVYFLIKVRQIQRFLMLSHFSYTTSIFNALDIVRWLKPDESTDNFDSLQVNLVCPSALSSEKHFSTSLYDHIDVDQ